MSLSNYTTLQAAVLKWLNRETDTDLAAVVPDFVTLVESRLRRTLRGRDAIVRTSISLSAGAVTLPSGVKEPRSLYIPSTTNSNPIDLVTPEQLNLLKMSYGATGRPKWAAMVGSELLLVPAPDTTYTAELIYIADITPLVSASGGVNWVLQSHPDIYLYGCLSEAEPYLKNDDRLPLWQSRYKEALEELRLHQERAEYGANSPAIRPSRALGG